MINGKICYFCFKTWLNSELFDISQIVDRKRGNQHDMWGRNQHDMWGRNQHDMWGRNQHDMWGRNQHDMWGEESERHVREESARHVREKSARHVREESARHVREESARHVAAMFPVCVTHAGRSESMLALFMSWHCCFRIANNIEAQFKQIYRQCT